MNNKWLSDKEEATILEALEVHGIKELQYQPKVALYLSERLATANPVLAYGYLLYAQRKGRYSFIDEATLADYHKKAALSSEKTDYDGALLVGKELVSRNACKEAIRYLTYAADSLQDNHGVAALMLADLLSGERQEALANKYYAIAAQKGNPDLLPCFSAR